MTLPLRIDSQEAKENRRRGGLQLAAQPCWKKVTGEDSHDHNPTIATSTATVLSQAVATARARLKMMMSIEAKEME